ncbi:type VI secretion system baseplate subunit TssF [Thalassomonas actiniarum]|uniref:Type VI secretion system baseplate subunit TssF n=1 Tax=Thalassomonas actiniarum TaxID=485447 RepID=A0AAE9YHS5_9GAMM|nr:type VI secretion system baseplate subunit TssF [Thalassomonas actiniarum]WDD96570.1 type VI secretion system baseplate subunit TssF [Thalassomonas actiniarum]
MTSLYEYFQEEMRFLRTSVADFSHTYPEVAAELKLSAGRSADADVEQLLQSFAYMTGQLRGDLQKQRDQIPNQLLHSLYPNLIRSLPCMTVLKANVENDGANFINGYTLEKGRQFIGKASRVVKGGQSESTDCQFINCYHTPMWPFDVDEIKVLPKNYFAFLDQRTDVQSVISVQIANTGTEALHQYPLDKLRFYIGDISQRIQLYRLLADRLVGCAVRVNDKVVLLDDAGNKADSAIQWLGFGREENVLPDDAGSHRAYRLLQEYFTFPEKFYFFEVTRLLEKQALSGAVESFEILFLLDETSNAISLNKTSFEVNCFPAINLFARSFKPVQLKQNQHEYRLLADERFYLQSEVHSISEVRSIAFDGKSNTVSAWLGTNTKPTANQYYITRLTQLLTPGERGCDTFLSIYDADFSPSQPIDQTLVVKGWCNNRRLPEALRVGQKLQLVGAGPMLNADVVEMPSKFKGASLDGENNIKLLSQLSLNLNALGEGENRLELLRQLLRLYCDPNAVSHARQLDGLTGMESGAVVKRIGRQMWRGHCRGTRVSLAINEDYFDGANALLLGAVLSYFFGLYTSLNHFVQLQLISDKREGVWKQWPARIGEQVIL